MELIIASDMPRTTKNDEPELELRRNQYAIYMSLIDVRLKLIDKLLKTGFSTGLPLADIELLFLQFRMIFETITFSSISAHLGEYSRLHKSFRKDWQLTPIVKNLKRINPHFYPRPIFEREFINAATGKKMIEFADSKEDALSIDELARFHGECGGRLHTINIHSKDLSSKLDDVKHLANFQIWFDKLVALLDFHSVLIPPSLARRGGRKPNEIPFEEYMRLSDLFVAKFYWGVEKQGEVVPYFPIKPLE